MRPRPRWSASSSEDPVPGVVGWVASLDSIVGVDRLDGHLGVEAIAPKKTTRTLELARRRWRSGGPTQFDAGSRPVTSTCRSTAALKGRLRRERTSATPGAPWPARLMWSPSCWRCSARGRVGSRGLPAAGLVAWPLPPPSCAWVPTTTTVMPASQSARGTTPRRAMCWWMGWSVTPRPCWPRSRRA
jgi:hypothetical protein